jgi:hypothetical protein
MNRAVNHEGQAVRRQASKHGEDSVAELSARLKDLRTERVAHEGEAGQLPTLLRAIIACRRNRDAGSSSLLAEHRASLEDLWSDVEQLLVDTARIAIWLHLHDSVEADPVGRRALRAIGQTQTALQELAVAVSQP